jgi:hypothetical protein
LELRSNYLTEGDIIKIYGTIRDSQNRDPVVEADIRIIIEGMQIDSITTNEQGEYEYATEEDYLEQTLDIIIQKEGFERKNISYEIDKAEIKSDILLNKLEKAKKEKTRIFGTIRNSKNRDPVKAASITLSIEGTEITTVLSNEQGEYEYTTEEDYKGQTLNYIIQKEGFIRKDISHEIERFEIKSDILMDEIEIKIKGKICDETDNPLSNASISFSIGDSTIDLVSDKDGSFSFTVGQQFLNQTIGYEVNKEGFKIKSGKLKLIEDLKCINLLKDTPIKHDINRWIRVAAVGIVLTGLAIYLFGSPAGLIVSPDSIDFGTIPPGDNVVDKEISISKKGWGTIDWIISKNKDWITVTPTRGSNSGTVIVSIDKTGLDTGDYNGTITIESNGGEPKHVNINLIVGGQGGDEQPAVGSIDIKSIPTGASISLDDSNEGTTPKTISGVSVGSHTIKITKRGYSDYTEQVTVTAGETTDVAAELISLLAFNFFTEASNARWDNGEEYLPWEGERSDPRGTVKNASNWLLEDGTRQENVLFTHPKWEDNGLIRGRYFLSEPIRQGDRFKAKVGFQDRSNGEVTFSVAYRDSQPPLRSLITINDTGNDGRLKLIDVDLTNIAGKDEIFLYVRAGSSSYQDWAVWVYPRIERSDVT